MPKKYLDDDGNEVETLTPEESQKLKEDLETAQKKLDETTAQVEKLSKKDFDYNALKNANEKEREEILSKLTATERALVEEQEVSAKKMAEVNGQLETSWKKTVRGDSEFSDEEQKVFDEHYKQQMIGKELNEENVKAAAKNALTLTKPQGEGGNDSPNPINQGAQTGSGEAPNPQDGGENKPLSEQTLDLGKKMGLQSAYEEPNNAGGGDNNGGEGGGDGKSGEGDGGEGSK